jgi:hypothetical protein
MANTTLYIGINRGDSGMQHDEITVQSTSNTGKDIELRVNAVDQASPTPGTIRRQDVCLALEAFERVIESMGIYTTDLAE